MAGDFSGSEIYPIICTTGGGKSSNPAAAGDMSVVIPKRVRGMDWKPKRTADKGGIVLQGQSHLICLFEPRMARTKCLPSNSLIW